MRTGATSRRWWPGALALGLALATVAAETDHGMRLTEAKVAADLGDYVRASNGFAQVAEDVDRSDPRRWDALLRLGGVRSAMGDTAGSREAFERVRTEHASDPQAIRSLALAVSGVVPEGRTDPRMVWPAAGDVAIPELPGGSEKITLAVEDMDLPVFFLQLFGDVHERRIAEEMSAGTPLPPPPPGGEDSKGKKDDAEQPLRFRMPQPFPHAYRAPAAIEHLDLIVHPGVEGKVSVRVTETPFREVLAEVLRSHRLRCITRGSVVWISRHEDPPPPADLLTARTQTQSVLRGLELRDAPVERFLDLVAKMTGLAIEPFPGTKGRITLRLNDLSGEEAFALVLWANGLTYTRSDDTVRIHPLGRR